MMWNEYLVVLLSDMMKFENIEFKIMVTLGFDLKLMIEFDNFVINVNVIGLDTCPNSCLGVSNRGSLT